MADRSLGFNVTALDKASATFVKLGQTVERLEKKLNDLDRTKADPKVTVDTRRAERDIGTFAAKMHARLDRAVRSLPDVKLGIDANTDAASRAILRVKREMESLRDKTVGVDIDAATAQRQMAQLSRELTRLGAQHPDIQVRADTAAASAALATVSAQARRLDGQDVSIGVGVQNIARAISMMGLLTAGIAAVGAAAPAAAAAVAAIPGAAAAAGQGIGALAIGFSGVGDAVKALSDQETEAAAGTSAAADQRVAAADRIISSQQALTQAVTAADRAAITGRQQVADAERAAATAVDQAADDVVSARQRLVDAGTAVVRAEADLHDARRQAIRDLQDLSEQVSDNALTVEGAEIALLRAQERRTEVNADAAASALDRREADLRVAEAQDRLSDAHRETERDQTALNEAQRRGVEGSRTFLAARFRLNDAEQAHAAALAGVQDALESQTRTEQDAARSVARAHQQAGWARQDANQQVIAAQRALDVAMRESGAVGGASVDKIAEAFANLGPEARDFARFLAADFLPRLREIRGAVQATLLPRMQQSLSNLMPLIPVVSDGFAETGRVLGDLAVEGSAMMASGPWRADFATIMAGNNRILDDFGHSGLSVADAFRNITVEALPMIERFSQFTQRVSEQFAAWIEGKRQSGELGDWFAEMGDRLAQLGGILKQVAVGVWDLSQALSPLGMVILETIGNTVEMIGEFARAHPVLAQTAASVVLLYSSFITLGKFLAGIGAASALAVGGFTKMGTTIAALMPAALATSLTGRMSAVALTAGTLTEKFTRSANAGQRVADTGDRVAGKMGKLAGALPAVGLAVGGLAIAWDAFNTSVTEAESSLARGGQAAVDTITDLEKQDRVVADYALGWGWLETQLSKIKPGLDEVRAGLGAVGNAQIDAAFAMRDFGEYSPQHQATLRALAAATKDADLAQRAAAAGTSIHTQRIKDQQGVILSVLGTEIAYRDSLAALGQALITNGVAFDMNTAAGRANFGALSNVIQSSGQYRQSLIDQGMSEDEATRKAWAHRQQLIDTMVQHGVTRGAAQRLIDTYMRIPPRIYTRAELDTWLAEDKFNRFIAERDGRKIRVVANMVTPQGVPIRQLGGGATGAVVDPMAAGGIRPMRNDIAQVVPPNTPRIIGDRVRGREYFLPDDDTSRTMAIGARWAADRGLRLVPMARGGMVQAEDGSWVPASFYAPQNTSPAYKRSRGVLQAEDGSWVPPSFYAGRTGGSDMAESARESLDALRELVAAGINPLSERLQRALAPALERAGELAGTDTVTAVRALMGSLLPLTAATATSGQQQRATWQANTAQVQWSQAVQTGQYNLLRTNLGAATFGMSRSVWDMQAAHNASWANMRATSGREVGTITGPIFGGLHRGMDAVQGHGDRMSGAFRDIMGRTRAYFADPIRWGLQNPINRGLQPAWAEIDRFFALRRPWRGVPIGFASGTEDHRAQIARGRQPRVWNEPETGGEAYVPLARSKRGRSTAILGDVADRFGYALEPKFFADGGLWRQMQAIVQRGVPGARISSTYRPGDPGYHGKGKAIDIGSPEAASNRWIARHYPNSTQLIYTPGTNLFRGRPHRYNAATRADHYDHTHWAMENAAMLGNPQLGAGALPAADIRKMVEPYFRRTRRMIGDIRRVHGTGNIAAGMTRMGNDSVEGAISQAERLMAVMGPGPGSGVERWRGVGLRSLAIARQPASNIGRLLMQMKSESGGDPNVVNRWDCLTLDAMILTRRGWLKHDEVQVDDETIGYNPATGRSEWTRVTRVMRYEDAELVRLGNSRWEVTCTPNHRWVTLPRRIGPLAAQLSSVCPECGWVPLGRDAAGPAVAVHRGKRHGVRADRTSRDYPVRFVQTYDIVPSTRLVLAAEADTGAGLNITTAEAALLGWIAGDGWIGDGTPEHRAMVIGQTKPQHVAALRDLLADVPHSEYCYDGRSYQFRLSSAYSQDLLARAGHPRSDAVAQVLAMSVEQRAAWLQAMIDAEGTIDYGKPVVYQRPGEVLDALTMAFYLSGKRPKIGHVNRTGHPEWSPEAVIRGNSPFLRGQFLQREDAGRGAVWCVTTELGSWTARQGEHVFLTGNSNWAKGTPSVGLMQVIGPTYRDHKHPQFDVGPYLYGTSVNPLSNVLAATRYTLARYGSLARGWRGRGYDDGGILAHGRGGWNMSGRPERVLNPDQTRAFERLVNVLDTRQVPRAVAAAPSFEQLFAAMARNVQQGGGGGRQVSVMPGAVVNVAQPVDIDLLSQRLAFAARTASF